MTGAGPLDLMDLDKESDDEDREQTSMPGVKKGLRSEYLKPNHNVSVSDKLSS